MQAPYHRFAFTDLASKNSVAVMPQARATKAVYVLIFPKDDVKEFLSLSLRSTLKWKGSILKKSAMPHRQTAMALMRNRSTSQLLNFIRRSTVKYMRTQTIRKNRPHSRPSFPHMDSYR